MLLLASLAENTFGYVFNRFLFDLLTLRIVHLVFLGFFIGICLCIVCDFGFGHFGQILSRKAHLDEEIYNQLVQRAIDEEYDVSKLHKTPQSETPPEEGEDAPKDTKGIWWFKSLLGK